MNILKKNTFLILLLFFIGGEIVLLKLGQFSGAIFFYILFCGILFFIDKKYFIPFFVFNLPILPFVPSDYKILAFVGPYEIIYGFSYMSFLLYFKNNDGKKISNDYQKLSVYFVYFLFFIQIFILLKDNLLGIADPTENVFIYIFKNVLRNYLYYFTLVILIENILWKDTKDLVYEGIVYSIIFLVISMLFTKELLEMGANVRIDPTKLEGIMSEEYNRFTGLWGAGGDENSLGIFMVSGVGFFLALFERNKANWLYILVIALAVFGSLLTGSRTAFLALATVVIFFVLLNNFNKTTFFIILALFALYFLFFDQIQYTINRFYDESANRAIDPNDPHGRFGKWVVYANWLADHPETLILGNLENINFIYAPHNYFIYLIYHVGLIVTSTFGYLFFNLLKAIKFTYSKFNLRSIYYIIPFPFALMTVNSFGSSIFLWLYLPMGVFLLESELVNRSKRNWSLKTI